MSGAAPEDGTAPLAWPVIRAAAVILCTLYVVLLGLPWWLSGHAWFLDAAGRPLVQDFLAYRIAGLLALEGRAAAAYDHATFNDTLAALTGGSPQHWLGWPYPPFFILLVTPLAPLPYAWAWFLWLGGTAALLLVALRQPRAAWRYALLVLAAPAALACVFKGQNGFLSAALLAGTLALLDRRPHLAGICLGLLAFKPHFGLVLPVLLVATGRWTVFLAAAATVLASVAAATLTFSPSIWPVFIASATGATAEWLTPGIALAAMQTVYATAAPLIGVRNAVLLHAVVALGVLALTLRIWRGESTPGVRAAAAIAATFLVTPYAHNHDAVMLGVAVAFLLGDAPSRSAWWEAPVAALALLLPAMTLVMWWGPPGIAAAAVILLLAWRHSRLPEEDESSQTAPQPSSR